MDINSDNRNWCGAGRMLSIDAAGNFYPCTRFAQYSLRSKSARIIGNIKDGIDKNKVRPFIVLDRIVQSKQECIECNVASGCGWCQGENYDISETGTISQRSTAICKMHKARVRANNYYWNKLLRISLQWYRCSGRMVPRGADAWYHLYRSDGTGTKPPLHTLSKGALQDCATGHPELA